MPSRLSDRHRRPSVVTFKVIYRYTSHHSFTALYYSALIKPGRDKKYDDRVLTQNPQGPSCSANEIHTANTLTESKFGVPSVSRSPTNTLNLGVVSAFRQGQRRPAYNPPDPSRFIRQRQPHLYRLAITFPACHRRFSTSLKISISSNKIVGLIPLFERHSNRSQISTYSFTCIPRALRSCA